MLYVYSKNANKIVNFHPNLKAILNQLVQDAHNINHKYLSKQFILYHLFVLIIVSIRFIFLSNSMLTLIMQHDFVWLILRFAAFTFP